MAIRELEFIENTTSPNSQNSNTPFESMDTIDTPFLSSNYLRIGGRENKKFVHNQSMVDGFTSTCDTKRISYIKPIIAVEII